MMSRQEYDGILELLPPLVVAIRLLDLEGALQYASRLETLAPMLAPTEYLNGGARRVANQCALIAAALDLQRTADQLVREAGGDDVTYARDRGES